MWRGDDAKDTRGSASQDDDLAEQTWNELSHLHSPRSRFMKCVTDKEDCSVETYAQMVVVISPIMKHKAHVHDHTLLELEATFLKGLMTGCQ